MFPADMAEQRFKLESALQLAVDGLRKPDRLAALMEHLGRRHAAYGVEPAHFDHFAPPLLAEYKSMFESTISFLWDVLGTEAFAVLGYSRRPTKIVYDPLMFVANSADVVPHRAQLSANREVLRTELEAMYKAKHDLFSGRRTNFADTQNRNGCVSEAFARAIAKMAK